MRSDQVDFYRDLGASLRAVRIHQGRTQEDLAVWLELHRPAISEIEAGRRILTAWELVRLSDLLGIAVANLLPEIGDY